MRTFVLGDGPDRKFVHVEVSGKRMAVVTGRGDGSTKRNEKEFASAAEASAAGERMVREVVARGYAERRSGSTSGSKTNSKSEPETHSARVKAPSPTPVVEPEYVLAEEADDEADAPVLRRLAPLPAAAGAVDAQKSVKPRKKKKRKKAKDGQKTDWLAIGGAAAAGVVLLGLVGYLVSGLYQPATLIGTWQGSMVEHEVSKSLTFNQYKMGFDASGRAMMIVQQDLGMAGTYRLDGDLLKLNLVDEFGDAQEFAYKIELGSYTLDLFDPTDGKKVVQLLRLTETEPVPGPEFGQAGAGAGGDLDGDADEVVPLDLAGDPNLAAVPHAPKDTAFACRYPTGWTARDGSRPDNTYSWAEFTHDNAKIRIDADVKGSLIADIANPFGGSPDDFGEPPVAAAHDENQRAVATQYDTYEEGPARPLNGTSLGEGRIAEYTAKPSGFNIGFSDPTLHGYRATLLTNNRRVTILAECPERDWDQLRPTFEAVIASVGRR